ncbi:MAG: response regulator [Firmicutes bacterium]|nr:response regulator [Bacillota bacterium]
MEKIKLLIVDDIAQTRTDLQRLLYFEEDLEVVGEAANGREAIARVGELLPDIVLMDINMPIMDGITATEIISRNYPNVAVVIVSIQGEQEYLKKAMVAGARDYLVKPISSEEISDTLRKVYELEKARGKNIITAEGMVEQKTREPIITFFSGKGGTGKSVIAVNMAVGLARQDKEVVLVDTDLQFGDISLLLNLSDIKCISDLIDDPEGITGQTLPRYLLRHNSGVHVISACFSPQDAEKITENHLTAILEVLEEKFNYIIIDTPCSFNDLTLLALEKAHVIMMPVLNDLATIKSTKTTMNILGILGHTDKIRLILNMEGAACGVDREDVEKSLGLKLYHVIPRDDRQVVMSINKGIPFVQQRAPAEAGKSILELCGKISSGDNGHRKKKGKNAPKPGRRGLFGKFRARRGTI